MVKTCKRGGAGSSSRRKRLAAMKTNRRARKSSEQKKISALINDAFEPINNYSANERRIALENAEADKKMEPVVRQLVSDLRRFNPASGRSKPASGSYGFKLSSAKPISKKKTPFWRRHKKSKHLSKTKSYNQLLGTNKYTKSKNPIYSSSYKDE